MARKADPTDLTDDGWRVLEPLLPPATPGGRPRRVDVREIMNAIRSQLRAGGAWRLRPHDLPPWETASASVRRWQADGTWGVITGRLRQDLRVALGRAAEPSAAILDSQTVKTTERGGRGGTTAARGSPAGSAISWSTPRGC